MAIYLILYVGVIGSGMYSRNAQILSRSRKKEFEKSSVRGTLIAFVKKIPHISMDGQLGGKNGLTREKYFSG